jgi:hypothetical protein
MTPVVVRGGDAEYHFLRNINYLFSVRTIPAADLLRSSPS